MSVLFHHDLLLFCYSPAGSFMPVSMPIPCSQHRVILGYSGGASSTMLLHILLELGGFPLDPLGPCAVLRGSSKELTEDGASSLYTSNNVDGTLNCGELHGFMPFASPLPPGSAHIASASQMDLIRVDRVNNASKQTLPLRMLPVMIDDAFIDDACSVTTSFTATPTPAPALPVRADQKSASLLYPHFFDPVPHPSALPPTTAPTTAPSSSSSSTTSASSTSTPPASSPSFALHPWVQVSPTHVFELASTFSSTSSSSDSASPAAPTLPDRKPFVRLVKTSVMRPDPVSPSTLKPLYVPILVIPLEWSPSSSPSPSPPSSSSSSSPSSSSSSPSRRDTLVRIFRGLSSTAREDLLTRLRTRLLVSVASALSCPRVLVGDNASHVAAGAIAALTKAAGQYIPLQLPWVEAITTMTQQVIEGKQGEYQPQQQSHESRESREGGILITRPLRDTLAKGVQLYLRFTHQPYQPHRLLLTRADLLAHRSLNRLTAAFVGGLQRGNEMTVFNIVRTCEKLGVRGVDGMTGRMYAPDVPMRGHGDGVTPTTNAGTTIVTDDSSAAASAAGDKKSDKQGTSATSSASSLTSSSTTQTTATNTTSTSITPTSSSSTNAADAATRSTPVMHAGEHWKGKLSMPEAEVRRRRVERGQKVLQEYLLPEEGEDGGADDADDDDHGEKEKGVRKPKSHEEAKRPMSSDPDEASSSSSSSSSNAPDAPPKLPRCLLCARPCLLPPEGIKGELQAQAALFRDAALATMKGSATAPAAADAATSTSTSTSSSALPAIVSGAAREKEMRLGMGIASDSRFCIPCNRLLLPLDPEDVNSLFR